MTDIEVIRLRVESVVQILQDSLHEYKNGIVRLEAILMIVCVLLGAFFVFEFLKATRVRK